ncbi:MAG: hypothetical protein HQ475_12805 [SAR202 cluster bacterium]|nr:hypothetical protein [SAR202 cluster bacterium]
MMRRPDESEAYDPRGLLFCMSCEVYGPYRTLRESNQFIKKHHGGSGVMTLRDRRPGWRKDRGLKPGYQQDYFDWMYRCHVAAQFFTDAEMAELLLWEKANLDGHSVATSDWPRWEEFVGRKPKHEDYD